MAGGLRGQAWSRRHGAAEGNNAGLACEGESGVIIILKPRGKGNWASVTVAIEGARITPLSIAVGDLFTLGGVVWRICRVLP